MQNEETVIEEKWTALARLFLDLTPPECRRIDKLPTLEEHLAAAHMRHHEYVDYLASIPGYDQLVGVSSINETVRNQMHYVYLQVINQLKPDIGRDQAMQISFERCGIQVSHSREH